MLKLSSVRMERAGKALAKLKLSDAISPDQLAFAAWPAAVGKRIAVHACPKALVRGIAGGGGRRRHLAEAALSPALRHTGQAQRSSWAAAWSPILNFASPGARYPARPPQSAQSHSDSARARRRR